MHLHVGPRPRVGRVREDAAVGDLQHRVRRARVHGELRLIVSGFDVDDDEHQPRHRDALAGVGDGAEQPRDVGVRELDRGEVVGLEVVVVGPGDAPHDLARIEADDVAGAEERERRRRHVVGVRRLPVAFGGDDDRPVHDPAPVGVEGADAVRGARAAARPRDELEGHCTSHA